MIVFKKSYPTLGMPEYQGVTQYYEGQIVELSTAEEKFFVDGYFAEVYDNKFDYYQPYDMVSDRGGNVVGVVGPDGNKSNFIGQRSTPIRVATFGDSTAESFRIIGTGAVDTAFIDIVSQAFPSTGQTLQVIQDEAESNYFRSNKRFFVFNGGISGQSTSEILARETSAKTPARRSVRDLLDSSPDIVYVRAGINDLARTGVITDATTQAQVDIIVGMVVLNINTIASRIGAGGPVVAVCSLLGYSAPTRSQIQQDLIAYGLLQINAKLRALYPQSGVIQYLDFTGITYNADNGKFLAGVSYDGLHLGLLGGIVTGPVEKSLEDRFFGASAENRYVGVNYFRNSTFEEEAKVSQTFGQIPGGYSVAVTRGTRVANSFSVESINGKNWFIGTFQPDATVTPVGGLGCIANIGLPFALSSLMAQAGASATSIFGVEFDVMFETLDGFPILGSALGTTINIFKTGAGRIALTLSGSGAYTAPDYPKIPASLSFKAKTNPMRIGEPAANIDDAQSSAFSITFTVYEQRPFRLGISSPRLVFLDQTFFNV